MKGNNTMENKKRLIVIGNGMAGTACVEEILKLGPDRFEITVFGAEKHLNYNRVLLSSVLTGEKEFKDISLHGRKWYEDNGVRLFTGSRVTQIKRAGRTVAGDGFEAKYDKLLLSTGSLPFAPPIPGIDKEGVFFFRDIEDCEKIKGYSKKGGHAVVIGGGLLGLEAAKGLHDIGMEVTVVHLMDRLMEKQLDNMAAGFLREDMERIGVKVLLQKETVEITGGKKAESIRFKGGDFIGADIVVLSIGIKPNATLARESGLYCERGVVVSDTMQTYDPSVYAVGECVQHRGATFGLVGPIFEQARVVANHLAGDGRLVFKNQPASTRLKIPGIELYSAGAIEENKGTEKIEYLDSGSRRYKKIIIEDNRIKGIILYGDTSEGASLFSSLLEKENIFHRRGSLLSGPAFGGASSVEELPDDAIVCGCNGVTKGMIVEAIEKKGLFTREDVKRETKASGSCGGCAGLVDQILEATLGSNFQGAAQLNICACTKYTRDDVIKNIREKGLKSVMDVMETMGWETVGCDKCRPALNYYVSMVWPDSCHDDGTSRLVNERVHANIQKDGTFSVVPRIYGGAVSPEELKRIADTAVKYDIPLIKITGGQRIDLLGARKEDLPSIWEALGMESGFAYGKAVRTVKTCVGDRFCRFGTQDSLALGIAMEKKFKGLWMPAKVKMSVSGCPRNCSEAGIKDIGVVGVSGGWDIYTGGCGGIELKAAERLCAVKTGAEVVEIVSAFLQLYREEAVYGERTFKWVSRIGLKEIKKTAVEDAENRKALSSRMSAALSCAKDPWKERVEGVFCPN